MEVGAVAVPRGLQQVRAKIVRCKIRLEDGLDVLRPGMEVDVTAQATLANVQHLWSRPVHVATVREDETVLLSFDGTEHSESEFEDPTSQ